MISEIKGYKFIAVMPESASIERREIIKKYGAEIVLTNGENGTNYSIEVAEKIINENPKKYVMLDQYKNVGNIFAHYYSTGPEILKEVKDVTHFVAGMGTGGTLMGVGEFLKNQNSSIKVIGIEPKSNSKIQGLRNMKKYTPPIFQKSFLDKVLKINNDNFAFEYARKLFRKDGISVGISSGAALWGAIQTAKSIDKGTIVTIFPDRGDRYISTELFKNESYIPSVCNIVNLSVEI